MTSSGELALWTGVIAGISGFAMALMSPLWGAIADRYGRKPMLLRAMLAGAILVILMGLARGPLDLAILRFLQGATSGTIAAVTAIVAAETPRNRVAWALGLVASAVAVGSSAGPLLGGLIGALFGLRALFIAGGTLLLIATVPVILVVRERPLPPRTEVRTSAVAILRARRPGTLASVAVLLTCVGLVQMAFNALQPLVVLRLLELLSTGVAAVTGIIFAAAGLAAAAAAVTYSRLARRFGYVMVVVIASVLLAVALVVNGLVPWVVAIVIATGVAGLLSGAITPALASMLGLEAPPEVQARVFGASASATAVGMGLGPLGGGGLAAAIGVGPTIVVLAVLPLMLAALIGLRGREPVR